MKIVSIDAFQKNRREQRKAEVLAIVEREMNKIHESNFEAGCIKIIDYAELMGSVLQIPGKAKEIENKVKRTMQASRDTQQSYTIYTTKLHKKG